MKEKIKTHFKIHGEKYLDILFFVLVFGVLLLWSMMLRMNDGPDETGRYSICQYIFRHGSLPHGGDEEIRIPEWGFSYAFQPILPFIIGAGFMKITALFTANEYFYIVAARFVSVLCGLLMAVFVRKISKLIFEDKKCQWIFTLLVCLLPQGMFMCVYVNTDSMALLSSAVILYAWLRGMESGWSYKDCLILSVGIILCALSYYNAYGFILCSIFVFAASFIRKDEGNHRFRIEWKELLKKGGLISGIVLIGIGWWFIRNYVIYDGDFLGLATRKAYGELYAEYEWLKPSNARTYANAGLSVFRMLKDTEYIPLVAKSFVGVFGRMDMMLSNRIYRGFSIIFLCGAGIFLPKVKHDCMLRYSDDRKKVFGVNMVICIIIPILLCTYYSYAVDFEPQGRYILPMLIPFMFVITKGISKIFGIIKNGKVCGLITALICGFTILSVWDFMKNVVVAEYGEAFIRFFQAL